MRQRGPIAIQYQYAGCPRLLLLPLPRDGRGEISLPESQAEGGTMMPTPLETAVAFLAAESIAVAIWLCGVLARRWYDRTTTRRR